MDQDELIEQYMTAHPDVDPEFAEFAVSTLVKKIPECDLQTIEKHLQKPSVVAQLETAFQSSTEPADELCCDGHRFASKEELTWYRLHKMDDPRLAKKYLPDV